MLTRIMSGLFALAGLVAFATVVAIVISVARSASESRPAVACGHGPELSRLRREVTELRSELDYRVSGPERRFMGTVHRPRKGAAVNHCVWCDGTTDKVADIETRPGQFFVDAPVCEACVSDPPSYSPRVSYTRRESNRATIGPRRSPHGKMDPTAEFSDVQGWRKPNSHNPGS